MITLKLEDKSYKLPENWAEVTLGQFQQISKLTTDNKLQYLIDVLSILTGLEEEIILSIEKKQLSTINSKLSFIYNQVFSSEMIKEFKIGDDTYTLKDLHQLKLGEVITIETIIEKQPHNLILVIDELMAVLFKKNGEDKFDATELEERAELFRKNLMIDDIYKVTVFFLTFEQEFLRLMKTSSEQKKKKMMLNNTSLLRRILNWIRGGIGFHWSRGWQMGTSLNLRKYWNKTISAVLTFFRIGKKRIK